jgi:hypothetical protein
MTTDLIGARVRHSASTGNTNVGIVRAVLGCSDGFRMTLWVEDKEGRLRPIEAEHAVVLHDDPAVRTTSEALLGAAAGIEVAIDNLTNALKPCP